MNKVKMSGHGLRSTSHILATLAKEAELDQSGDLANGRETVNAKRDAADAERKKIAAVEEDLQFALGRLKVLKKTIWDQIGLGPGNRGRINRLGMRAAHNKASGEKLQAELQKVKKRIDQELTKMRQAVDRKEEAFNGLRQALKDRAPEGAES